MPLFHISVPDLAGSGDYTVSPDGEHIVVNTFISDPVVPPIDVVVNWPALLKRESLITDHSSRITHPRICESNHAPLRFNDSTIQGSGIRDQ